MTDAAADDLDAAIEKMGKIANAVKEFDSPEVQAAAFAALAAAAFGTPAAGSTKQKQTRERVDAEEGVDLDVEDDGGSESVKAKKAKKAPPKRGKKASYDVPKDINFAPKDNQTLADFVDVKKPASNPERALVAVHYITEVLGKSTSVGSVIAAFKFMNWTAPANPANNLQVAGNRHWLETSDSNNITVVYAGDSQLDKMPKSDR